MSNPLPTNGSEYRLPPGAMLVSRTDAAGIITYANEAFTAVSGYSSRELLGQSHSIDRHPDVPAWVFEGMWRRLQKGMPWRGVLLNRRKNGDYYWVDAFIAPVKRGGETTEYLSVRLDATPDQIAAARKDFAAPYPPERHRLAPSRFLSVKRGVLTGVLFVLFALLVTVGMGQRHLDDSVESFYELHAYRELLATVAQIDHFASVAQNQLLVTLRHLPENARVVDADAIEIPEHLAQVRTATLAMTDAARRLARQKAVLRYLAGTTAADESVQETAAAAALLRGYLLAVDRYAADGVNAAVHDIERGRLGESEAIIVGEVGALVAALHAQSAQLGQYFDASADRHHGRIDELMLDGSRMIASWIAAVIAVIVASSVWFFRRTMRPLQRAIDAMRRISQGDLSERLDVYGFGEPGEVVSSLAAMQIHLKVMLDEIRLASSNVHRQIGKLNETVVSVLNSTEDAHLQASQILSTLESTGADTARLASASAELLHRLPAPSADDDAEVFAALASETASLAALNDFAASEVRRMSQIIMAHLVTSREGVNYVWSAGQELETTSRALNEMFERFKQGTVEARASGASKA